MADLYARITDAILRQIDAADPGSWVCPWHRAKGGLPRNALTGRSYRGINTLSLWCGGQAAGYADQRWATYRQWSELGAQVRKGEQGTPVLFFKDFQRPPNDDDDGGDRRFVARASTVFNAEQVVGAQSPSEAPRVAIDPVPLFNTFVDRTGAVVKEGEAACYIPSRDEIRLPARDRFRSTEGYCSTLAHELVHWTGAKARLDRDLSTRFGERSYAAEELVAELGSAFVMAQLGIAPEPHPQHAAYMAGWLPLLRSDDRALFTAASLASKAAQFLQGPNSEAVSPAAGPSKPIRPTTVLQSITGPSVKTWVRGSRIHSHGW